jgi:hypothetical protein
MQVAVLVLICPGIGHAHPESISELHISLQPKEVHASLILCIRDLGSWFPPTPNRQYMPFVEQGLQTQSDELIELQFDDVIAKATQVLVRSKKSGTVEVDLTYPLPASTQVLQITTKHIGNLPGGHKQLLFVEDERTPSQTDADDVRVLLEDTLTTDQDNASIELPSLSTPPTTRPAN